MNAKLKQLRQQSGITQIELARLMKTSVQYICNVENCFTKISQQQAQKWAMCCGYELTVTFTKL